MPKIAVVGGGISGLALTHRLFELTRERGLGNEISLFEAGPRFGGTLETENRDGFILEKGPDAFISEKPWALDLSKRLGLESQIIGTRDENRASFILRRGRLVEVPQGFYLVAPTHTGNFLKSPLFSPAGKFRMMLEPFIPARNNEADESVAGFIRRRFGRECLERVGQPMLAGIYTGDPERLSLKSTMPRFLELEKKYKSVVRGLTAAGKKSDSESSGPRYSLFLSYKDGMETLAKKLVENIPAAARNLNTAVSGIDRDERERKWRLSFRDGRTDIFDTLVLALPANRASDLLSKEAPSLSAMLDKIPFESVATINFAFKRDAVMHPLNGFGFVVPRTEEDVLVACSFTSQKFPGRAPKDYVLLRAFAGGAFGKHFLEMPDSELLERSLRSVSRVLGISGRPLFSVLKRYPGGMVQYAVGHSENIAKLDEERKEIQGLYFIGASFKGVGIPDCIHEAELTAEEIAAC